jgi:penicillin amidase
MSLERAAPVDEELAAVPQKPPRSRLRLALIATGGVLLLVAVGVLVWLYWSVQKTLPTLSGNVTMPGLSAAVTVTRDNYGVPHIVAENVEDLYAAQGYVHAQDRLFQMSYFRSLGAGTLAKDLGGREATNADIFLRTVGMRRAAEAELPQLDPEVRRGLEAYARGVNAFLSSHQDNLPLEFQVLGNKVEEWSPLDSVAFGKVMTWDLSGNWDLELVAADLEAAIGPTRTAQLIPDYPTGGPFIVPGANSGRYVKALQVFAQEIGGWIPGTGVDGTGSNNWVVDGTKSVTGKPVLANDPHLGVQNPSIWYQVHLSTRDGRYDVAGFGFAGAPGVVTGHNRDIAWGVTNASTDVQDLFIERMDDAHPGQYLTPDGWQPIEYLTETIEVKGGETITHTVRITRHGPILSDALKAISSTVGATLTEPLALQWTAARPGHLLDAVYELQTASNWEEFRSAVAKWSAPGQNFVYADREGNIGYQLSGEQVLRKGGKGKVPVPGWTGEFDWQSEPVPFEALPSLYNPPEHFIATANNRQYGAAYSTPFEGVWAPPWRYSRIVEMLEATEKLSAEDHAAIQTDTHSAMAKRVSELLAKLQPTDPKAQEAVKLFEGWEGDLSAESSAATVYELTVQKALSETYSDDLGFELFVGYLGGSTTYAMRGFELLVDAPNDPFWDREDTSDKVERRDDILLVSFEKAVSDLVAAFGDDTTQWSWGTVHTITPRHTFGGQPVISGVFNLERQALGGDNTTVAVAGFDALEPFETRSYQSYRMIIDVGDWGKSKATYPGGQSGQPFARHWGDKYGSWLRGEYLPLLYAPEELDAQGSAVLTLSPP